MTHLAVLAFFLAASPAAEARADGAETRVLDVSIPLGSGWQRDLKPREQPTADQSRWKHGKTKALIVASLSPAEELDLDTALDKILGVLDAQESATDGLKFLEDGTVTVFNWTSKDGLLKGTVGGREIAAGGTRYTLVLFGQWGASQHKAMSQDLVQALLQASLKEKSR
jgi:hypothetical protein